ncbi:DUF1467 family protein [Alphaproteobacteria bacterium KMM 3653]|uniref:DUF1467 family protein n=1 Tax=Harenicola maris TaxID=2841044 RepID=A0AAP2CPH2_9RHOB|nr:DUF1467 family protein [Harenicola maris]
MAVTSALVLFAVIWFMVMFIMLPIGMRTQGDEGEVVPGTMKSSPVNLNIKRKMWQVTGVTVALWAITSGIILSGWISVSDFDLFSRFGPGSSPVFEAPADGTDG